jgi:hypothetical protein
MEALHSHGFGLPFQLVLLATDIRFRTCRLGILEKHLFINLFAEPGLVLSAGNVEWPPGPPHDSSKTDSLDEECQSQNRYGWGRPFRGSNRFLVPRIPPQKVRCVH